MDAQQLSEKLTVAAAVAGCAFFAHLSGKIDPFVSLIIVLGTLAVAAVISILMPYKTDKTPR